LIEHIMVGGFTLDDTVMESGRVIRSAPGGNALYAAAGARLWSSSIGLLGPIGDDYPEEYLDRLRRAGIDLAGVCRLKGPNIHMWVLHESDGRRQLIYQLASGNNAIMDPRPEYVPTVYHSARSAHVAALPLSTQTAMIGHLRSSVPLLSMDAVYIPGHIELDMDQLAGLLGSVDVFLPSREEVNRLLPDLPPICAARRLTELGPGVVAVKLGDEGVVVFERGASKAVHVPAARVTARDTTGAGDAFCGAFNVT
jgi:ribokinase